ncbi:MAG: bifunctional diaminohydroxyphosphoribosylaminopyrimidine deaminase/5-amino-6-(5-phosphoribosylamino)uracil reductase RibD [Deltaproteobacteria bacterium]|nr:bifunctional diaminohydroxyphosphoribosylaminopyrimidine deaminase/5-amino-6-(5-phosphoribosylamino)uracil reductase RibD [Deltaproteobacteria bacterium]
MEKALQLAAKGRGRTSPNPMVGAVVVKEGLFVGSGYHAWAGGPHAEVNALRDAGEKSRGATLYVTLEPCNHFGRTPPCTAAILKAGISRVVVGMADPNPRVQGGGAAFLRERGIEVAVGVGSDRCRLLNQPFIKHVTTGLPLVTLKAAMTLDGRIAAASGDSRWISNERSRNFVHRLRSYLDAVLVGIETALQDDPQLTARLSSRNSFRQPIRIILDTRLRLPLSSNLVRTAETVPVWVACAEDAPREAEERLRQAALDIIRLPRRDGRLDLEALLGELGRRDITSLLVEGGSKVLGDFMERRLADDFYFFYAPKILGDPRAVAALSGTPKANISEAQAVHSVSVRRFGSDVMLHGRFRETLY